MIHSFKQESWVSESIPGQCQSLSLPSWSVRGTLLCLLTALGELLSWYLSFPSGACDCSGCCFEKCVIATFLLRKLPRDQIAFSSCMKPSVLWSPAFCLCRPTTMASSHDFSLCIWYMSLSLKPQWSKNTSDGLRWVKNSQGSASV